MNRRGFTLLELLIVISILAVLATVVVVALNPAETLRKARDTQRMADITNLKSAIVLYQEEVSGADIGGGTCTASSPCSSLNCTCTDGGSEAYQACSNCSSGNTDPSNYASKDGWIPMDFSGMSPAPIAKLPVDPTNNATYHYSYAVSGTNFEIDATLESTYYTATVDADGKDGGNNAGVYEVGTDLTILP